MPSRFTSRLETYIGIGLLLVAVLGFIFSILSGLPRDAEVKAVAHPLKEIPRDLFSSSNELNKTIGGLNTPSGIPVTVSPESLGKNNVFGSL
ncbi:MAG: hypothetical protein AAB774_02085 [Patescibacteria group bacterium]